MSQTRTQNPTANGPVQSVRSQEKETKRKYLRACLGNCPHFTPCVLLVEGLLGREAKTFAKPTSHSQTSCREVAEALLASLWIGEGKAEQSSSSCHPLVPAKKQSPSAKYQHPILAMGRRSWFIIIHGWNIHLPPLSLLRSKVRHSNEYRHKHLLATIHSSLASPPTY